jgi:hypothetical protein
VVDGSSFPIHLGLFMIVEKLLTTSCENRRGKGDRAFVSHPIQLLFSSSVALIFLLPSLLYGKLNYADCNTLNGNEELGNLMSIVESLGKDRKVNANQSGIVLFSVQSPFGI